MPGTDALGQLVRWYVLAQPRLSHLLCTAARGAHPTVLLAELYSAARGAPSSMLSVLEFRPDDAPMVPSTVVPVPPAEGAEPATIDPDTFMARWYIVHEATLEGTLEAAAAGENPHVLTADLYSWAMSYTDARVRIAEVPIPTPAMVPLAVAGRRC